MFEPAGVTRPSQPPHGYCTRCATPLAMLRQEDRERPTCAACGYVVYLDPKVAVAVLLPGPDGTLLLGQRSSDPGRGRWSFPAGYVDRGEVLEDAARREVREELGVSVRLTGLVGVYSGQDDPVVLVVYAGAVEHGDPTPDGRELSQVRAFPLNALPDLAFRHDHRILADWQRQVRGASLRERSRPGA